MDYYGTVGGFFEYCRLNGYDVSDLGPSPSPEDEVEIILRRGSSYIDGAYLSQFPGSKTGGRDQPLAWPRRDAVDTEDHPIDEDEVPVEIVKATYEAALREFENPGALVPDVTNSERVKSESVGPLSVTYADSKSETPATDSYPVIGVIDRILAPLLGPQNLKEPLFGEVSR